ncbi:Delta-12 fatty acid desaturase [Mycena kentingensis (nom. inval.)]|nr:Delta-12 fatty acid desaturase [Mycena kentingensis (nom. inval.)]
MLSFWHDSPEYEQRKNLPFSPPKATLAQVRAAVPKHLFKKNTTKGMLYVARDVLCAVLVYKLAWGIDSCSYTLRAWPLLAGLVRWSLWLCYWWCEGIILAGWWCMAHEVCMLSKHRPFLYVDPALKAGHGNLSANNWVNHAIGFSLHSFLLTPFYAWRASHHAHHKATMSVERDENYVPRTRRDFNLPDESTAQPIDYHDIFEDAPFYTLLRILIMQLLGWPLYLFTNVMGNPRHPAGTNHFLPSSSLFQPHQRNSILFSDLGLCAMSFVLYLWTRQPSVGLAAFIKLYFIPWMCVNHWIVMLTYLHHVDPTIPYFRKAQWSFLRGAVSTVDRPFLGWAGRFFLHNVSHDHISHHLFSSIPFYNQPLVTQHIKEVLKENYNYDSTNSFRALYRTFTQCCFIEDDGDIVFYKNKDGVAARSLATDALARPMSIASEARTPN